MTVTCVTVSSRAGECTNPRGASESSQGRGRDFQRESQRMPLRPAFVAPALVLAFIACAKHDDERRVDANATNPASDAGVSDGGVSDADAADATKVPPMVDLSQLGPSCEDNQPCPPDMYCASYQAINTPYRLTCGPNDPCDAMICPPGMRCTTLEKEPPTAYCIE